MPVLDPKILSELAARATELAAEVHTNVLMKRSVDHRVLETLAVGMFPQSIFFVYYLLELCCLADTLKSPHVSSASEATCIGPLKFKANRCIDYKIKRGVLGLHFPSTSAYIQTTSSRNEQMLSAQIHLPAWHLDYLMARTLHEGRYPGHS